MVPNHMGIDSRWVIEHPDWFISRAGHARIPATPSTGPTCPATSASGIYLEDHYYDNTDAAVVFKRVDRWTGDERYVYHGNDGTSFPVERHRPARLPEAPRSARRSSRPSSHVARQFPVIRFDAAMTLAKRTSSGSGIPEPGQGGAIPSRAEYAHDQGRVRRRDAARVLARGRRPRRRRGPRTRCCWPRRSG